jgi:hypothetical protein
MLVVMSGWYRPGMQRAIAILFLALILTLAVVRVVARAG